MAKIDLKSGDTINYGQHQYRVIENRVTQGKDKQRAFIAINVIAIFIMIVTYLLCFATLSVMGVAGQGFSFSFLEMLIYFVIFVVIFLIFIVAHEYVHYLAYIFFGGIPKNKLKFGVVLKSGMAYCISLEPNTVRASRLSLMMPLYVLVIPVFIAAILTQNSFLAFLTAMFASGSGGDIWYMWTLRKDNADKYMIETMPADDGYEIGYLLLEKDD